MIFVTTTEACRLLGISASRIKQLLYLGRIRDAEKVGRFWRIPLFNGVPEISKGKRGPKGTWRKKPLRKTSFIHINRQKIAENRANQTNHPVITVKQGNKNIYCNEVEIFGPSKIIYRPELAKQHAGASVWIEVPPDISLKTYNFCQLSR